MKFEERLKTTGEVGFVEQTFPSIAYISGLPSAKPREVVIFEGGEVGMILSLMPDFAEALLLTHPTVHVGSRVARTDEELLTPVGTSLLGATVDPLGRSRVTSMKLDEGAEKRHIDIPAPGLEPREDISELFETGVSVVDLVVPIGKGQRELVIGDHKIGKSQFLLQAMLSHSQRGGITIYGAISKRQADVVMINHFIQSRNLGAKVTLVTSLSSDASGMIYLTPYTAMTMAEYFRDQGEDVLVILDDLSIHAKYYREISLLAKRFPGRSSYPGDIFYAHSRLMERAGKFHTGSITCLPVAETVLGDISGYIATNLMSMTDGHIYFDQELYNQGRRPAVNPFLSVTRVGHQTQSPLMKSLSRELSSFLVHVQKLKQLMHFGGELNDTVKKSLSQGELIDFFFTQAEGKTVPLPVNAVFLASIWAGYLDGLDQRRLHQRLMLMVTTYATNPQVKDYFDGMLQAATEFKQLVDKVKLDKDFFAKFDQDSPAAEAKNG